MQLAASLMSSLADCFTPEVARRVLELRPNDSEETRLTELRVKAEEGLLTPAERAEYEEFVDLLDRMVVLKSYLRVRIAGSNDAV
jgi:hypothetical protein